MPAPAGPHRPEPLRHSALVRVTHWLTFAAFVALLVTGGEIVISHPRFYWGETGNDLTRPLFSLHIPASRDMVPTGYGYTLPDQNGWSRYLHFEAAWVLVFTALVYGIWGLVTGHFRRNLLPEAGTRTPRAYGERIAKYLRRAPADAGEARSYNVLQRTAYLGVIFILFPLIIATGLALSPSFNSVFPALVDGLGGRQSARTLHFFVTLLLVLFLVVHVAMVALGGFRSRMRAMIAGRSSARSRAAAAATASVPAASSAVLSEERP
ncbi:MAG TPA: cytochrome b/b6 domain-containing protein [Acidobacteriaceae bacterium]|nr:cytochrome b/b6 domain-containing protein [Acidobacteriaceae bacterium]